MQTQQAQQADLSLLYKSVSNMTPQELDALPCGAIQLDKEGKIINYNKFESSLSGVRRDGAIGRNFFTELAPCTDVREFHGRFKEGVARKRLHEKFRYHFSFKKNPRNVLITLFYHEEQDKVWVFVQPID